MDIKEVCRSRKDALNMTYQDVADKSGIPFDTVKGFFSGHSKAPSVYTVGAICRALGVSLDELFEISEQLSPTEETWQAEKEGLEKRLSTKRDMIDSQAHSMGLMEKGIRMRNHLIAVLFALLVILLLWCIHLDMQCTDIGFWRG